MKFGHLLKSFESEAELPADALLNYKKLKKLIKSQQRQSKDGDAAPPAAAATAASAEGPGGSSEEEEFPPSSTGGPSSSGTAGASEQPASVATVSAGGAAAGAAGAESAPALGGEQAAAARAAGAALGPDAAEADAAAGGVAEEDLEFIHTLNEDLSRINAYFMEREEEAVIRLRALQDARGAAGADAAELERLRSKIVDFHGELVLLLHWSLVNYAAVAKILKKHDKLTGSRLRAPVLASVLHQPFLSTESISQLVREAERHVQELTALCGGAPGGPAVAVGAERSAEAGPQAAAASSGEGGEDEDMHVAIYKRTRAALHMLNDMQETASTPSTLLPPSTANSDAAPEGKKLRTAPLAAAAAAAAAAAQQQQASASQQSLEVEAH